MCGHRLSHSSPGHHSHRLPCSVLPAAGKRPAHLPWPAVQIAPKTSATVALASGEKARICSTAFKQAIDAATPPDSGNTLPRVRRQLSSPYVYLLSCVPFFCSVNSAPATPRLPSLGLQGLEARRLVESLPLSLLLPRARAHPSPPPLGEVSLRCPPPSSCVSSKLGGQSCFQRRTVVVFLCPDENYCAVKHCSAAEITRARALIACCCTCLMCFYFC